MAIGMTPELWLSILAIIVSVVSAAYVILEVGIKMGVGYREQETTSTKKDKIDKALADESITELENVTKLIASKEASEEDRKERILNLGRIEYYGDFAEDLLDKMGTYNGNFRRSTIVSGFVVFFTIVLWGYTFQDVTKVNVLLLISSLVYSGVTILSLRVSYLSIRKYFLLRDAFVRLSEKPSCDKCEELSDNLEENGISI